MALNHYPLTSQPTLTLLYSLTPKQTSYILPQTIYVSQSLHPYFLKHPHIHRHRNIYSNLLHITLSHSSLLHPIPYLQTSSLTLPNLQNLRPPNPYSILLLIALAPLCKASGFVPIDKTCSTQLSYNSNFTGHGRSIGSWPPPLATAEGRRARVCRI
jgi:hypothetical protein